MALDILLEEYQLEVRFTGILLGYGMATNIPYRRKKNE